MPCLCHRYRFRPGREQTHCERWRSEDSDAEKDLEGLVDGEGADRERARTNLFFGKESVTKERLFFRNRYNFLKGFSFSTGFLFCKTGKSVWTKRSFAVASEAS